MDDIYFIPAVAASVIAGLFLWWAIGRYRRSRLMRTLAAVASILVGFVLYFVLAMMLAITLAAIHPDPDLARETGAALGHGFSIVPYMLMVVAVIVVAVRASSGTK